MEENEKPTGQQIGKLKAKMGRPKKEGLRSLIREYKEKYPHVSYREIADIFLEKGVKSRQHVYYYLKNL